MMTMSSFRQVYASVVLLGALGSAVPAAGSPLVVSIDPNQSVLTFQLCVTGLCDDDTSTVTGTMTVAVDCVDFPTGIWLHDFHLYLDQDLDFYLSWSFLGSLTATAHDVSLHYAEPGIVLGPEAISGGAFTFPSVSATRQGTLTYYSTGIPCAALQAAGHPCNDTRNLANEPPTSSGWGGTVSSAGRTLTLTTNVDNTQPLDENNPTLGTMRVYGTVRGSVFVPRPLGDVDGDGDVDLLDFSYFADCLLGPEDTAPLRGCSPYHFDGSDLDRDGDTDLADFAMLQQRVAGLP